MGSDGGLHEPLWVYLAQEVSHRQRSYFCPLLCCTPACLPKTATHEYSGHGGNKRSLVGRANPHGDPSDGAGRDAKKLGAFRSDSCPGAARLLAGPWPSCPVTPGARPVCPRPEARPCCRPWLLPVVPAKNSFRVEIIDVGSLPLLRLPFPCFPYSVPCWALSAPASKPGRPYSWRFLPYATR